MFTQIIPNILSDKRWKRTSRQVEIKKLSESFAGKPKSVERNLADIATYISSLVVSLDSASQ